MLCPWRRKTIERLGCLPVGSSVFVIELLLLLQPVPESAAEETALVLGKRSSHRGSSCGIQVGLDAQRKAAEDRAGGDSRPRTSHTGPLWVTICKSLGVHL